METTPLWTLVSAQPGRQQRTGQPSIWHSMGSQSDTTYWLNETNVVGTRVSEQVFRWLDVFRRRFYEPNSSVFSYLKTRIWGFPGSSDSKECVCNAGDPGSISGSGSATEEGNGNPLQYPCLENSTDSRAWKATVHGITKSQTWLSLTFSLFTVQWGEHKGSGLIF